jgi:hypothetical protein
MGDEIEFGTIDQACAVVGGGKPIDKSTYYRNAKLGLYTKPTKVSPNVSRVDMTDLRKRLRNMIDSNPAVEMAAKQMTAEQIAQPSPTVVKMLTSRAKARRRQNAKCRKAT